jgi:hypothetical protein
MKKIDPPEKGGFFMRKEEKRMSEINPTTVETEINILGGEHKVVIIWDSKYAEPIKLIPQVEATSNVEFLRSLSE